MAAANPANYGPPATPIPTQEEYDITINGLINHGWVGVAGNRDYDWGDGRIPGLFRQDAMTAYQRVRKPDGRWLLFSRRIDVPVPPNNPGQGGPRPVTPSQGGRKMYKQKKSKKNKKSRKRRRTRKHK
jgi:hypothetical protein